MRTTLNVQFISDFGRDQYLMALRFRVRTYWSKCLL